MLDKVAAQLFTLREYTQTPKDFSETIKRVKDMGFNTVQLSYIGPMEAEYIKEVLDENEVKVCVTHVAQGQLPDQVDEVIRNHQIWDCKNVGLGGMKIGNGSKKDIEAFCHTYSQVADQLAKVGMTFHAHNHAFEFQKVEGKNVFDYIQELTCADRFKLLVDVYWVQVGGANPIQFLEKYKKNISIVHLKDLEIIGGKQTTAPLGQGNMDLEGIITRCEDIGVEWYAIEQDQCLTDPFECLRTSLTYLKNLGFK